jgi:hypothetical protein
MLIPPKHSLDRLLTMKAGGVRDLIGSITANLTKCVVNVGIEGLQHAQQ